MEGDQEGERGQMNERTGERDVGVGGETSALNFREDTHGMEEPANARERPFQISQTNRCSSSPARLRGGGKFWETHLGHKPGQAGWARGGGG